MEEEEGRRNGAAEGGGGGGAEGGAEEEEDGRIRRWRRKMRSRRWGRGKEEGRNSRRWVAKEEKEAGDGIHEEGKRRGEAEQESRGGCIEGEDNTGEGMGEAI